MANFYFYEVFKVFLFLNTFSYFLYRLIISSFPIGSSLTESVEALTIQTTQHDQNICQICNQQTLNAPNEHSEHPIGFVGLACPPTRQEIKDHRVTEGCFESNFHPDVTFFQGFFSPRRRVFGRCTGVDILSNRSKRGVASLSAFPVIFMQRQRPSTCVAP